LNAASEAWKQQSGSADAEISLAKLISSLIDERNQARSAKDFATSDRLRDQLAAAGIVLADGADGTTWRIDG
ncbi:MAG: cysteine--tRNA ligase, partial [Microbacteriaceae bacterium]